MNTAEPNHEHADHRARLRALAAAGAAARTETIHDAMRNAQRWRDVMWQAVLEGLGERAPDAPQQARTTIQAHAGEQVRRIRGSATQEARWAWPHLDAQARDEWIWVCEYIHQTWMRNYLQPATPDDTVV